IHALVDVLEKDRPGTRGLNKLIKTVLKPEHREMIGKVLVEVAAAVDGIDQDERKSLRRALRSLQLEPDDIDRLLKQGAEAVAEETVALDIDLSRIRAIRAESDEAARVLLEAIEGAREAGELEEDTESGADSGVEADVLAGPAQKFEGLRDDLHPLVAELVARTEWTAEDFEACARRHGSSTAAAIEEINAWSDDALGDFLIEEGATLTIN